MREPLVRNKYGIKPKDIEKAIIINKEKLKQEPFWRNEGVQAYCLSDNTIKNSKDSEFGTYNSYWIGFYDQDAKQYAGKIRLSCNAYGGICSYNFKEFFNPNEIECDIDLEIQEKLLKRINWLIEEKIIQFN